MLFFAKYCQLIAIAGLALALAGSGAYIAELVVALNSCIK